MPHFSSTNLRGLAWIACAFAFCVIVFGAFVRLSNAGLSCPDWPTCYGHITWPQRAHAIAKADAAFPDRPYETHKAWREQTHRFLAGTLGVLVLVLTLAASWRTRRRLLAVIASIALIAIGIPLYMTQRYVPSSICAGIGEAILLACALFWRAAGWRRIAVLALAVVAFQALLGMWTVTWLLKPIVVSGHLLGGMTTFALLAWIAWQLKWDQVRFSDHPDEVSLRTRKNESDPVSALFLAVVVGLALLACQIFLGGWTSSNYAALACGIGPDSFPKCLGAWWPPVDFHQGFVLWRGIGVNFEGGILDAAARSAIQIAHRFGALVVFVYLAWLAHKVARAGLRGFGIALGVLLLTQVALGISNVMLGLPLAIAVAHNGGAALLLFTMVSLLARTQASAPGVRAHATGCPELSARQPVAAEAVLVERLDPARDNQQSTIR
ncbi:MAG TPA: COX15/CtaA family protein [Rhodanobacteraceae bacterium]|nr:COX15/CtaA family protein [Rhodanobacteraceae bacterium]